MTATLRPAVGMYGPPPERTVEQRRSALAHATDIRIGNAQLRRDVRALAKPDAFRRVADLLEHPDGHVGSMPVGRLLGSIERVGLVKVERLLTLAGVRSSGRRVDGLSDRQRKLLASTLRREGGRWR
jgi:hypothetical protein